MRRADQRRRRYGATNSVAGNAGYGAVDGVAIAQAHQRQTRSVLALDSQRGECARMYTLVRAAAVCPAGKDHSGPGDRHHARTHAG